jgi:hypothetical protein
VNQDYIHPSLDVNYSKSVNSTNGIVKPKQISVNEYIQKKRQREEADSSFKSDEKSVDDKLSVNSNTSSQFYYQVQKPFKDMRDVEDQINRKLDEKRVRKQFRFFRKSKNMRQS